MKRNVLMLVSGLVCMGSVGAAIYYRQAALRWRDAAHALQEEQVKRPAPVAPTAAITPTGTDPDARVQALEKALAESKAELAALRTQASATTEPAPQERAATTTEAEPARPERRNWLEELRTTDPERYEEIQERRAAFRQRVQDSFARQTAHFLYRDREQMTTEEQQVYDYMLGLLGETWQLADRMQDTGLAADERREIGRRLFQNARELRPLLEEQRDREFYEMAVQLGYDSEGAAQFVDYINEMIDVTSLSGPWTRGGGGGRRREQ